MTRISSLKVLVAIVGGFIAAASSTSAAIVSHIYELNGSYSDTLSGPSLVPTGGSLGASGYSFGNPANAVNEGLSLSNAFANPNNYSIEMRFRWTGDLNGFGRILDFNLANDDRGIYTLPSNQMGFWMPGPGPTGATMMGINTDFHVVFTRDSGSNTFKAFLNGTQQFSFTDSTGLTSFSSPANIAKFFIDEAPPDTRPGIVDQIRIFDGPLSAVDVQTLYTGGGLTRSPIAQPGGSYSILNGDVLVLNASSSSDPDQEFGDNIVAYDWDLNGDGTYDFSSTSPVLALSSVQYAGLLGVGLNNSRLRVTDRIDHHTGSSQFSVELIAVPEPSTLALGAISLVALLAWGRTPREGRRR